MNPWVLLIIGVAGILIIVNGAVLLMRVIAEKAIGSHHRAAEIIVTTGKIPPAWINRGMSQSMGSREIEEQARKVAIARLDALIAHFGDSPFIADEETRQILLDKLRQVRRQWHILPWRDIMT